MNGSPHVSEQLDEWIDGRLSASEERQIDRHLEECGSCRAEADALRAVRAAVAGRAADVELPAGLEDRIRGLLDAEDARARDPEPSLDAANDAPNDAQRFSPATSSRTPASHKPASRSPATSSRTPTSRTPARGLRRPAVWALPLAAGLLLAVGVHFWATRTKPHPEPVAKAFLQFSELTGTRETWQAARVDHAGELERRWHAAELGFPVRVLDLSMMNYVLAGGRATRLGERPAALAIYRGPTDLITCWMIDGRDLREETFPAAVDVHEANGLRFYVFESQGVTLVLWREGDVLCILSGRMGRKAVVELAHAKAMAPQLA